MPIWKPAIEKEFRFYSERVTLKIPSGEVVLALWNEGLSHFVNVYNGNMYQRSEVMFLDESESSFTLDQMKDCWQKSEDSCAVRAYTRESETFHDWDGIRYDKKEYFKNTYNIDL